MTLINVAWAPSPFRTQPTRQPQGCEGLAGCVVRELKCSRKISAFQGSGRGREVLFGIPHQASDRTSVDRYALDPSSP